MRGPLQLIQKFPSLLSIGLSAFSLRPALLKPMISAMAARDMRPQMKSTTIT